MAVDSGHKPSVVRNQSFSSTNRSEQNSSKIALNRENYDLFTASLTSIYLSI